jgi:hypothetical protein
VFALGLSLPCIVLVVGCLRLAIVVFCSTWGAVAQARVPPDLTWDVEASNNMGYGVIDNGLAVSRTRESLVPLVRAQKTSLSVLSTLITCMLGQLKTPRAECDSNWQARLQ